MSIKNGFKLCAYLGGFLNHIVWNHLYRLYRWWEV